MKYSLMTLSLSVGVYLLFIRLPSADTYNKQTNQQKQPSNRTTASPINHQSGKIHADRPGTSSRTIEIANQNQHPSSPSPIRPRSYLGNPIFIEKKANGSLVYMAGNIQITILPSGDISYLPQEL